MKILPVVGWAQGTYFQQWNIEDGLSNQVVRNIAQDSHGFIWITTEQGLNRFDGENFTYYINIPNDSNSISHNLLFGLDIDQNDVVWVGSELGLNSYDPALNKWSGFQHDPQDPHSLSDNYVRTVFVDSRNRIWVGTQNGLNLFDRKQQQFVRFYDNRQFLTEGENKSFSYNRINDIYEDKKGRIWIGLDGGGVRIYESGSMKDFTPFYVKDTLRSRTRIVRKITEDKSGQFWFGTDAGLARYDADLTLQYFFYPSSETDSLSDQYVWDIVEGPDEHLWVSTYRGGINVLDRSENKFINHFDSENGLTSDLVWSLLKDKAGGIWVGCDGAGGINYHHANLRKFGHHLQERNNEKFNVESLFEYAPNRLLVSTDRGLLSCNLQSGVYERLTEKIQDESQYFFSEKIDGTHYLMSGNSIFELSDNLAFIPRYTSKNLRVSTVIVDTYADENGNIWIGTLSQGLLKVNLERQTEEQFFHEGNTNIYQDSRSIRALAAAPDNKLWVSSVRSGLFLLDSDENSFEQFLYHTDEFYEPTINAIVPESDEVLWLGTSGQGLIRYEWKENKLTFLGQETPELGLQVSGLLPDANGALWISTKNGFARLELNSYKFHVFSLEDGLQSRLFNPSVHQGESGKMYFGGSNGFNVFDPVMVTLNDVKPKVYLESLSVNDRKIESGDPLTPNGLIRQESIQLPYDQNYLKFDFSSPTGIHAAKTSYDYRLAEDQQWQNLGNTSELALPNLPVGEYNMMIRASNNDGIIGDPVMIDIHILPPFWRTNWFRLSSLTIFLIVVFSIYQYRMRQVSRQNDMLEQQVLERTFELKDKKEQAEKDREVIAHQAEELKELDKVKSKFFANISHELRTPLTLINGPLESFLEREGKNLDPDALSLIKTASQNGVSLYGLVEEILDLTKLEAGKLPLTENPILIQELLMDLFEAYSHDLKEKGVEARIDIQLPEGTCLYLDGRKVKKVLNNFLSNARKFTQSGDKIHLIARKTEHRLVMVVRDTGKGIDPADLPHIFDRFYQSKKDGKAEGGTGIGLALSTELAKLMDGKLGVTSDLGKGSEFTFDLPFRPAALEEIHHEVPESDKDLVRALNQVVMNYVEFFNIDKPTLLLAEDNLDMRKFIARVFEGQFRILEAKEGREALTYLESERVDLMISDVMMPGMDGFELLNALKGNEQLRALSVIMLTARAAEEDKLFALTKGVDDYLTKPFNKSELLARVKNILENRVNRHEIDPDGKVLNIDQQFLLNLQKVVEKHMDHRALSVSFLSDEVALSQRQLQRKIKEITGLSPLGFIKEIRLQKAYRLLANREIPSVSEAARKVGFEKADYFSSQFIARFGKRPSSML